jgi:hypothetical protein
VEIMKHIACSGMGLLLILGITGVPAGAQNQTPSTSQTSSSGSSSSGSSLGDYARQVRKDPGSTSKPKVYDNDNLPREDKLSVVGPTPATTTGNTAAQTDSTAPTETGAKPGSDNKEGTQDKAANQPKAPSAAPTTAAEDEATKAAADKQWADKITAQKDQIDLLGRELDVLQREYQIRAAAMYADAGNRMRNSADWDKQDTQYKQQIADKQKSLDDAKQKLEDLQEEARKAGASASARE